MGLFGISSPNRNLSEFSIDKIKFKDAENFFSNVSIDKVAKKLNVCTTDSIKVINDNNIEKLTSKVVEKQAVVSHWRYVPNLKRTVTEREESEPKKIKLGKPENLPVGQIEEVAQIPIEELRGFMGKFTIEGVAAKYGVTKEEIRKILKVNEVKKWIGPSFRAKPQADNFVSWIPDSSQVASSTTIYKIVAMESSIKQLAKPIEKISIKNLLNYTE